MQNRRDFLKTATLAALGSGLVVRQTLAGESSLSNVYINSRPLKSTHLRDIARKQCPADFFNK